MTEADLEITGWEDKNRGEQSKSWAMMRANPDGIHDSKLPPAYSRGLNRAASEFVRETLSSLAPDHDLGNESEVQN